MIEIKEMDSMLKKTTTASIIGVTIIFMIIIAYQQRTIKRNADIQQKQDELITTQILAIADASRTHDEFIKYLSDGSGFTVEDGQALFYLLNTCGKDITHNGLENVYNGKNTEYKNWLFRQNLCIE